MFLWSKHKKWHLFAPVNCHVLIFLVWSAKGHSSIINSIDGAIGDELSNPEEHLVVTGSRDGSVKVIGKTRNGLLIESLGGYLNFLGITYVRNN